MKKGKCIYHMCVCPFAIPSVPNAAVLDPGYSSGSILLMVRFLDGRYHPLSPSCHSHRVLHGPVKWRHQVGHGVYESGHGNVYAINIEAGFRAMVVRKECRQRRMPSPKPWDTPHVKRTGT